MLAKTYHKTDLAPIEMTLKTKGMYIVYALCRNFLQFTDNNFTDKKEKCTINIFISLNLAKEIIQ